MDNAIPWKQEGSKANSSAMDPGQRGLPPLMRSFLMGIIACAALYYYCKDGSLLNDFVRMCLKLRSSLYFFFYFLMVVVFFLVCLVSRFGFCS